jgi:hypothetical protein
LAQRQQWARSRPACVKFATTAPPLADIQPATLRHILQPHTGRAPPLAPAIRITAQTSRRVSGAIARAVLSPSGKLRRQPRPHRPSNHAVPLAEMPTRKTASPCESLRPHPALLATKVPPRQSRPFKPNVFGMSSFRGDRLTPLQPLLTRNLTPWPLSRCDDAVQQKFSPAALRHSPRSLRCKIPKPPSKRGC